MMQVGIVEAFLTSFIASSFIARDEAVENEKKKIEMRCKRDTM